MDRFLHLSSSRNRILIIFLFSWHWTKMNKNLCNFTELKSPIFQPGNPNYYFDFAISWKLYSVSRIDFKVVCLDSPIVANCLFCLIRLEVDGIKPNLFKRSKNYWTFKGRVNGKIMIFIFIYWWDTRLHLVILQTKTNDKTNFNSQKTFSLKNGEENRDIFLENWKYSS